MHSGPTAGTEILRMGGKKRLIRKPVKRRTPKVPGGGDKAPPAPERPPARLPEPIATYVFRSPAG